MAQMRVRGIVASFSEHEDKFNGEVRKDSQGNPKIKRTLNIIDMEGDDCPTFKIKVQPNQVEAVKALAKQSVELSCSVGVFKGYTFYDLLNIKAA